MARPESAVSIPLQHVNPVETYYVYEPKDRCFTCRKPIWGMKKDGHPSFYVFLENEDAERVKGMFGGERSYAGIHPTVNEFTGPGGFVNACWDHEQNLKALQKILSEERAITARVVRSAMTSPSPVSA